MKTSSLLRRYTRPLATIGIALAFGGICAALSAESPQTRSARPSASPSRSPSRSPSKPNYKERPSENPVRFVFSSKPEAQNLSAPGADPSAAAIWSTLLTGNISPEIVRWHIHQRQQSEIKTARSRDAKRSEYEKMLRRTEFSLAPKSNASPLDDSGRPYPAEPTGGAILARFLTGRENAEIAAWKNEQAHYLAARSANGPENSAPHDRGYFQDFPAEAPRALMNERSMAAAKPPIPRPLSDAVPAAYAEAAPTAELARAERPMVDDHFPAAEPKTAHSKIRPASAEIAAENNTAKNSGRMKVYRPRGSFDEPSASDPGSIQKIRPLPQNDPEEWSPVQ